LVIHIGTMSTDEAASVICNTVELETFRTTPKSQQAVEDIAAAAQIKAAVVDIAPDVDVVAAGGFVQIHTAALLYSGEKVTDDILAIAKSIDGVKEVKIGVKP